MVTIEFRFLGGRYHSTPWGSHVNEGVVEWPPCPWRLLRAFVATGFSKLGWDEVPADVQVLIEKLAAVLPEYRLPRGEVGHSRHYMPKGEFGRINNKPSEIEATEKVLDTFVRVAHEEPLRVCYPLDLSPTEWELLRSLVENLSYLGRAESWVEAVLLEDGFVAQSDDATKKNVCRPCLNGDGPERGGDQVALLAPISAADYLAWRQQSIPPEPPSVSGEKKAGKKAPKAGADKAWPEDLLACLCTDTSFLQKHGWSQPPGSRRVLYNRPAQTLEPRPVRSPRKQQQPKVHEAALLSLTSDTIRGDLLPQMLRCVRQTEMIHASLVSILNKQLRVRDCPALIGRDAAGEKLNTGHQHAHYLPLDLDEDGRLDHVVIWAPMGLDATAQRAISRLRRTWTKGSDRDIFVTCAGFGELDEFRSRLQTKRGKEIGLFPSRKSAIWTSCTPYIPPRHLKPKNARYTLEDDIKRELAARGLPMPTVIEVLNTPDQDHRDKLIKIKLLNFVRTRRKDKDREQPAFGLRLTFAEPIAGPIAIGYGSHFGLGLMAANETP